MIIYIYIQCIYIYVYDIYIYMIYGKPNPSNSNKAKNI